MSTSAVIGLATSATSAHLGYINSDGYPTAVLPTLRAIANRLGSLTSAVHALIDDGCGWYYLDDSMADYRAMTIRPEWADAPRGSVEHAAWSWHQGSGECIPVAGVGLRLPHGATEDWPLQERTLPSVGSGIEWAYLLVDDTLHVLWGERGMRRRDMESVASFTLDELNAADGSDFMGIYVGPDYTRASLMAWAVFDDVPEEARNLTHREWLGLDPMGPHRAIGVTFGDGRRIKLLSAYSQGNGIRDWSAEDEDGNRTTVRVRVGADGVLRAPEGARFAFPPTRADFADATAC